MKIETLRELLPYEQEVVDWIKNYNPSRENLLDVLKLKLAEPKTAEGYNIMDYEIEDNGDVLLSNISHLPDEPFCRITT